MKEVTDDSETLPASRLAPLLGLNDMQSGRADIYNSISEWEETISDLESRARFRTHHH